MNKLIKVYDEEGIFYARNELKEIGYSDDLLSEMTDEDCKYELEELTSNL